MDCPDSDFLTAGVLETAASSNHFNTTEVNDASNKNTKISTLNVNVRRNKIECVHESLDDARVAIDLLGTLKSFLDATTTTKNDTNQSDSTTVVAKEAISACVDILGGHVETVSNLLNYTKERSSSKQAHSKLTKQKRREAQHAKLEMDRAIKKDPKKALKAAIQNARVSVQHDAGKPAAVNDLVGEKRKSPDESNDTSLTSSSLPLRTAKKPKKLDGAKQEVLQPRVPPPRNGLMYHPFELKDALIQLETNTERLSGTKNKNAQRSFKSQFKQEIMKRGYVPIKKAAINTFAVKYVEKNQEPPLYWNQKGRRDYMSVDDLYAMYQQKKIAGYEWTIDDTKEAVFEEKKAHVLKTGKDPDQVKAPEKKTVDAYHSALMSMVSRRTRELACQKSNVLEEI